MKPIIGILGNRQIDKDNPFNCYSKFLFNYAKRIRQAGGIPMGLVSEDVSLDELSVCDGFVLEGGNKILDNYLKVIDYGLKKRKPVLGVCLGAQAMGFYDSGRCLKKVHGHNPVQFDMKFINDSKHDVFLDKNSKVYEALKRKKINVYSLHSYAIDGELFKKNFFKVSGKASDGTIEVLENKGPGWVVGVQFHPELNKEYLGLFDELIKEAKLEMIWFKKGWVILIRYSEYNFDF